MSRASVIDRNAVARGAAIGVLLFVPLSAARVAIDRNVKDFDHSGWAPAFAIALFTVYVVSGFVAARMAADAPYSNGMIGAIGAFVGWIPIRILIWAVRDSTQPLFTGRNPALTVGGIFGQLIFAAFFGVIGGYVASRRSRAAVSEPDSPA
ncbi:MAG: hypothetical protein JJE46_00415 [Acidimicrobiia bacterium]|nr:hypothetical protein [Acidimicrobiia bacterium]